MGGDNHRSETVDQICTLTCTRDYSTQCEVQENMQPGMPQVLLAQCAGATLRIG